MPKGSMQGHHLVISDLGLLLWLRGREKEVKTNGAGCIESYQSYIWCLGDPLLT